MLLLISILVPGIGHRVKSRNNPDLRVSLVKEFCQANFPSTKLLDYAIAVETVTTSKKDNLILNVDGAVAVCFVDLMRNCGAFSLRRLRTTSRWVCSTVCSSLVAPLV